MLAKPNQQLVLCSACDGTGNTGQPKACRCCRAGDPDDVRCWVACRECDGGGTVPFWDTDDLEAQETDAPTDTLGEVKS